MLSQTDAEKNSVTDRHGGDSISLRFSSTFGTEHVTSGYNVFEK